MGFVILVLVSLEICGGYIKFMVLVRIKYLGTLYLLPFYFVFTNPQLACIVVAANSCGQPELNCNNRYSTITLYFE